MHTADPRTTCRTWRSSTTEWPRCLLPIEDTVTSYYFRMRVADQPGVLADITRILADGRISIDAWFQASRAEARNQTDHHHAHPRRGRSATSTPR